MLPRLIDERSREQLRRLKLAQRKAVMERVICNGNAADFAYLKTVINNLLRHPGKPGEVAVALRSDQQGAGRATRSLADMSRFSRREGHEVVAELKEIAKKATVYFYETGNRYVFGDIGANISNYAVAEANADYRRKVRTKTVDSMKHKAKHGHVLGGHCSRHRSRDLRTLRGRAGSKKIAAKPRRRHGRANDAR